MKNDRIVIGRLRACLHNVNGSQDELAAAMGMGRSTLSMKLNGHRDFHLEEIVLAAKYLNLSDEDILVIFFPGSCIAQQYLIKREKVHSKPVRPKSTKANAAS